MEIKTKIKTTTWNKVLCMVLGASGLISLVSTSGVASDTPSVDEQMARVLIEAVANHLTTPYSDKNLLKALLRGEKNLADLSSKEERLLAMDIDEMSRILMSQGGGII